MRDKFLTEAMGEHYHTGFVKCECGKENVNRVWPANPDFSTWEGFGKLWEWATYEDWWEDFTKEYGLPKRMVPNVIIHPSRFAQTIYEYLKNKVDKGDK